tara:strand:- start:115 stop:600 length:486 start_codon:yes stop_codon:yes gene_type:complete
MSFKIIDNYLNKDDHSLLKTIMESDNFPWFFNDFKIRKGENKLFSYQFVHIFYINDNINSDYFKRLEPLLKKIDYKSLIRIKANLNPISNELIKFDKHTDQNFKCKSAIYYVNNNNGFTIIDGKKIESKKNRIVFFDSQTKHYGTNSTNCNNRMVINFNYF